LVEEKDLPLKLFIHSNRNFHFTSLSDTYYKQRKKVCYN
jgi:hypothetical protein